MATNNGVSRFDGYGFTNYYPAQFGTHVLSIDCDDQDRIWVSGDSVLNYIEKGKIHKYEIKNDTLPFYNMITRVDFLGRIWLVNIDHNGGYVKNGHFHPLKVDFKINDVYTKNNTVLLATDKGLYEVNAAGQAFPSAKSISREPIYSITEDKNHRYYFGAKGKIITETGDTARIIKTGQDLPILNIALKDEDKIWFSNTAAGLSCIIDGIEINYSQNLGLSKSFINDLHVDDAGNLFIASYSKGLVIINNKYIKRYNSIDGFITTSVTSILTLPDGTVFFGGYGGHIAMWQGKKFKQLNLSTRADDCINDMVLIGKKLWIASSYYISCYDLTTNKVTMHLGGAVSCAKETDTSVLMGSYTEIYRLSNTTAQMLPYDSKIKRRIRDILFFDGETWGATKIGTFRINKNGELKEFTFGGKLSKENRALAKDDQGNIWVATNGGLIKIGPSGQQSIYTTRDGLINNECTHLLYNNGTLWIGTARGLCSFKGGKFFQYLDVIPLEEISALEEDIHHNLWIGTNEGLYQWDLNNNPALGKPARVFINTPNHSWADTFYLPYRDNAVSLNFSSVEYNAPSSIIYEYKLQNSDTTWHTADNRTLQFSSLNSGEYRLDIRCHYQGSNLNSEVSSVYIVVATPVWKKWWFTATIALLVAIGIWMGVRYRIRVIKKRERQRSINYRKLLLYKQQAVNALVNPHFIFNSLNSIQHFINQADVHSANKYLSQFGRLIRGTMENSTNFSTSVANEIKMTELYLSLEEIRMGKKLSYTIAIDSRINKEHTFIPTMLIQPFVENAIWHGIAPKKTGGCVAINIQIETTSLLKITITDDGVGIGNSLNKKGSSDKSMGMDIINQRLDIIEKLTGLKIYCKIEPVDTNTGEGTRIELLVPANIV